MSVEQTTTWLHLGDMHVRADSGQTEQARAWRALAEDVAQLHSGGWRPDFLFITGDVAYAGKPQEYDLALELLTPVIGAAGLESGQVYVVPGNHDVDRVLHDDALVDPYSRLWRDDELRQRVDEAWEPELQESLMRKFLAYQNFAQRFGTVEELGMGAWRAAVDVRGIACEVIGLNSAWLCGGALDAPGSPIIGMRQRERVLEARGEERPRVRFVLQHHPAQYLNLLDGRDHIAWLALQGCVCLSGHVHESSTLQIISPDGGYTSVIGGALYHGYSGVRRYNWGRVSMPDREVALVLRKMTGGRYTADGDRHQAAPEGMVTLPPPMAAQQLPANTEMRFLRDEVELTYADGFYDVVFGKLVANDSLEPLDSVYARLAVSAFPDDPRRASDHHREHPLGLEQIGFRAEADTRDIEVDLVRDEDANKELMLRFYRDGEPAPLEPGERAQVRYTFRISSELWGPYIERHVRVPTDQLICRLRCRPEDVVQVSAIENPHLLKRNAVQGAPRLSTQDGVEVYEWSIVNPPRNSRYRLIWNFVEPAT